MIMNSKSVKRICGVCIYVCAIGCETKTVEYHNRPSWHASLSRDLPSQEVRDDGTVVHYGGLHEKYNKPMQEYLDSVVLEEKNERTGKVTLRALFPEHVLDQTLKCLRDKEWDILFDQIISTKSKEMYLNQENGREEFDSFFATNRRELARTLQRIRKGIGFGDVIIQEDGEVSNYVLSPRIARDYTYRRVSFVREEQFLKLHSIQ